MARHDAQVRKALPEQADLKERREHCSVEPRLLAAIGREVGQQVRIERNREEYGLYTVSQALPDAEGVVRMGLRGRQRLGTDEVFAAVVDSRSRIRRCRRPMPRSTASSSSASTTRLPPASSPSLPTAAASSLTPTSRPRRWRPP
jgi:hypothetical protein